MSGVLKISCVFATCVLCSALDAGLAAAQTIVNLTAPAVGRAATAADVRLQVNTDPTLISPFRAAVPTLSVGVLNDTKAKVISAQAAIRGLLPYGKISLAFSAPFDSDENETIELASLDGLVGSTNGEVAWVDDESAWGKRLGAKIGHREFSYLDGTSLTKTDVRFNDYSFSGSLQRLFTHVSGTASYRYEKASEAADKSLVCRPIGTTSSLACSDAIIGAPTRKSSSIADGETRMLFAYNGRPILGLSLAGHYDFTKHVVGVEVPLYFLPDQKDGGLAGGVRFGYRHEARTGEDKFTLAAFLGNLFSLRF